MNNETLFFAMVAISFTLYFMQSISPSRRNSIRHRLYYLRNKKRLSEKYRKYYYDNHEKRRKYNSEYYKKYGYSYEKERLQEYYQNNRERIRERRKKWYQKNRESIRQKHREYYANIYSKKKKISKDDIHKEDKALDITLEARYGFANPHSCITKITP